MNNGGSFLDTPSTGSTIRPRKGRLISYTDDSDAEPLSTNISRSGSNATSPFPSRGVSPLPKSHPSRPHGSAASDSSRKVNNSGRASDFGTSSISQPSTAVGSGLWGSSWSSLQGLASNVLGGDTTSVRNKKSNGVFSTQSSRKRLPKPVGHHRAVSNAATSLEWGPSVNSSIHVAAGTKEDRQAYVQAKKRETLLSAGVHASLDSIGRFKRRDSDETASSAPPAEEQDRDALVYVHHVKPEDTLAGVMIKYGCQPPVFRKVNRFWPNDNIQIRKVVLLPVDACTARGRKVSASSELDLLGDDMVEEPINSIRPTTHESREVSESVLQGSETPLSVATEPAEEPLWKHESWVQIDNIPGSVEIGRVPRRTLGFFPPSRRKSITFSDLDTPSTSLDIPRLPSLNTSPASRPRRDRSSSGTAFANHLKGPGGVGTLGKAATGPGPGMDSLNKMFAHHLPNVAPRSSFESTHSNTSTGIDKVGGTLEGWVRSMATNAAKIMEPPAGSQSRMGDLIELDDAFTDDANDGNVTTMLMEDDAGIGKGSPRVDQEALLRERFPPRGRMLESEARRKKGD